MSEYNTAPSTELHALTSSQDEDAVFREAVRNGTYRPSWVTHGTFAQQEELTLRSRWERRACKGVDTETFYPPEGERGAARKEYERIAKAICETCVVKTECLEGALRRRELYGVWGGLSEDERSDRLKRRSA